MTPRLLMDSDMDRAARFVCKDYLPEAGVVSSLLEKMGWQTLQERREALA